MTSWIKLNLARCRLTCPLTQQILDGCTLVEPKQERRTGMYGAFDLFRTLTRPLIFKSETPVLPMISHTDSGECYPPRSHRSYLESGKRLSDRGRCRTTITSSNSM